MMAATKSNISQQLPVSYSHIYLIAVMLLVKVFCLCLQYTGMGIITLYKPVPACGCVSLVILPKL